jgi:ribosome assembly protein RRB1
MGKKSKRNRSSSNNNNGKLPETHRLAPALREPVRREESKDNLQFEDPFVEPFEEEEYIVNEDDDDEIEDDDDDNNNVAVQSWNPFAQDFASSADEPLEMEPSAYKMYHAFTADWPCLSFDFLADPKGAARTKFPHSFHAVFGTQAAHGSSNHITVVHVSDLSKLPQETEDDILGEEYDNDDNDDDSSSSSSEEEIDLDPRMEHYSINHDGGVNRIRAMPTQSNIVASWSDTGNVHIYNVHAVLQRFDHGATTTTLDDIPKRPIFTHRGHAAEGYALDWSTINQQLVTGDILGGIHVWQPQNDTGAYSVSQLARGDNTEDSLSVEDLQWSPTEATVVAAATCGGYVRIYDTRAPNRAMVSHKISSADVNVVSWNRRVTNLLATGNDDGVLSVWDLRQFANSKSGTSGTAVEPLARFAPHTTPMTSVEWHPTDESMLACSDDVGTYVYDLSVEEDDGGNATEQIDVPPQLLFVHSGSEQFKEVHWHPQITSCLMTTALSGFSVFIPSNL